MRCRYEPLIWGLEERYSTLDFIFQEFCDADINYEVEASQTREFKVSIVKVTRIAPADESALNDAAAPAAESTKDILLTDAFKLPLPLRILKLLGHLLLAAVDVGGREYIVIHSTRL